MSKLGRVNLELQEQANELGFSTVQEALDNGYEVDYFWNSPDAEDFGTHPELVYLGGEPAKCEHERAHIEDELEEAHKAWFKEKREVLDGLYSVYNDIDVPLDDKRFIKQAIEFIEKGEV